MTNSKSIITVIILNALLLIMIPLATGSSTIAAPPLDGPYLFTDAATEGSLDTAGDPTIVRTRFVNVNFDLLGGANAPPRDLSDVGDVVVLNPFDDVVFSAVLDRVEPNRSGGYSWIGHLERIEHSQVILVVKGGLMAGNITLPEAFYQVRYAGNGVHAIYQINQSAFPPEVEPIPVDTPNEGGVLDAAMADDGSSIDVLVVYTGAARSGAGGTTAMENLINLAVAETNQSYANSVITQRLNLVHMEEVSYDESGFNWLTTLIRLTGTSDGYMDNVHTLRDTYCADEVVLIVNNTDYCGMAWLMITVSHAFEDSAFAVVSRICATGYYSFGHELGHNMGARHDWYVDDSTTPYPYNHGYVNVSDQWRTVMAYYTECTDNGVYCTRLQYWSNPDVYYGGDPMGVAEGTSTACTEGNPDNPPCDADNRKTLNNTAYTVANWRESCIGNNPPYEPSNPTPADGATDVSINTDLSWTGGDPDADDTVTYDVYFEANSPPTVLLCDDVPTPACDPGTLVYDTHYYWYVVATDNHGASTTGATWDFTTSCPTPPAPALSSPSDGSSTCDTAPTFSWDSVSGATSYRIQVDNDPGFGSPEIDQTTSSTSYTPLSALAPDTYYWRVQASNFCGDSSWSSAWSFTILSTPSAPSLSSPSDGSTIGDNTPTFSWGSVSGATSYRVQVDNNSGFSSPEIDQTTSSTSYIPGSALPDDSYYWRVQASNSCGTGSWSAVWQFTIDTSCPTPPAPTLTSPSIGSSTCETAPTFSWGSVSGATSYRIHVDNDPGFGSLEINETTSSTSYTPLSGLAPDTYYWRMQASNSCGDSSWSSAWSFTISSICKYIYLPAIFKNSP